ncbi:MAG: hypothetical protein DAHOPDDO_00060 [Ignavibacteriaceae bacterium]|nr:hypothetical protein [Ignavibacteriaceae bacterium]
MRINRKKVVEAAKLAGKIVLEVITVMLIKRFRVK